jgi:hypothetical protein
MKELATLRAASLRPALPPAGSGALTAPPWSWPATPAPVTCSPGVSRSPATFPAGSGAELAFQANSAAVAGAPDGQAVWP